MTTSFARRFATAAARRTYSRPVAGLLLLPAIAGVAAAADAAIEFNRDIRPVLSDNCFACHGPDASNRKADLRLDLRDAAIEAGAIVPGAAAESGLVERIRSSDPEEVMPPPTAHKTLSEDQKALLARWVEEGATYRKHWAFEKPVKPAVPAGQSPIDHLVRTRLAAQRIVPSPEADRRSLIRRLAFDLTGLPPTAEEVDAFVGDPAADAYERLVDRLLASPHYGERMAIGWLDVVRYADTIGYHSDNPRNVWPYRDWVIRSFNANEPFDRFTIQQLAGDLLPDATTDTRIASCFNRLLLTTEEGGAQPKDYEVRMLTDRVRAVGAAWLGQTTGCAQCHDHKFDPFTMRDFYSLGAFFADIQEPSIGKVEDGMVVIDPEAAGRLAELDKAVAEAKAGLEAASQAVAAPAPTGQEAAVKAEREALVKAAQEGVAKAEQARNGFHGSLPRCLVSVHTDTKRTVRILHRGNWMDETGDVVKPALPGYLTEGMPAPADGRELTRLDLATWLVSPDNPLTARVFVNRLWKQFFGAGLSRKLDDLGAQGEPPVHAELLDWLACEFVDSKWDVKHMVRTIVTSATYRQSSVATQAALAADPLNRELGRQSAWRIDAEFVRDHALAASGLLVRTVGGPSVKPYQPDGYWENLNFPKRSYDFDRGELQYRRGLYTWWQRSFLHPSMLAFDAPPREECCAERTRSNIPQQALVLLNDPTYVEAARVLAARMMRECAGPPEERIAWAFGQVLQRKPRIEELETLVPLVDGHLAHYRADAAAARRLLEAGIAPVPEGVDPAELAAWTHLVRVLFNLHETITRS
ncbi:MAG: PSD1 and planctomycete cytochrome C domain-containing protein [Pirellulales bacterium]